MNCPVCNVSLAMSERQGLEIDYCPKCRGIWLEKGKLDKIIERSTPTAMPEQRPAVPAYRQEDPYDKHREKDHKDHGSYPHKKKGFLQDLFD
jgi:Zn-finger nucleic acid-binding protein